MALSCDGFTSHRPPWQGALLGQSLRGLIHSDNVTMDDPEICMTVTVPQLQEMLAKVFD